MVPFAPSKVRQAHGLYNPENGDFKFSPKRGIFTRRLATPQFFNQFWMV